MCKKLINYICCHDSECNHTIFLRFIDLVCPEFIVFLAQIPFGNITLQPTLLNKLLCALHVFAHDISSAMRGGTQVTQRTKRTRSHARTLRNINFRKLRNLRNFRKIQNSLRLIFVSLHTQQYNVQQQTQ